MTEDLEIFGIRLTDVEASPVHYIHVHDNKVEVCDTDLGREIDVRITATLDECERLLSNNSMICM